MTYKGKRFQRIKSRRRNTETGTPRARRPMPKPTVDMGSRKKYSRRERHREDWTEEITDGGDNLDQSMMPKINRT
ncbi:MAG TPA: hypothetical protein ENL08_03830 [Bacteroidetes bacterium]|nr:hypothetical protein [Bacteroidota bacterium]